jgi:hypothetical protein
MLESTRVDIALNVLSHKMYSMLESTRVDIALNVLSHKMYSMLESTRSRYSIKCFIS